MMQHTAHKVEETKKVTFSCITRILISNIQCDRTVALDAFFTQIIQYPVKIGWIGSGCSVATTPTAEISHQYNITQVQP